MEAKDMYLKIKKEITKGIYNYDDQIVAIANWIESEFEEKQIKIEPDYEPYMGWCDVEGCDFEACGGGGHWRETGYWLLCLKHMGDCRNGKTQPKMKQESVDRENNRDENGYLSNDA